MARIDMVKLKLALMGRPVRDYTFEKPQITVGRDPDSDVFVDNPGISREHFRIERTEDGIYRVVDLGSANGTLLNERRINVATVRNNDVVRFGKYTLWVGFDASGRMDDDARVQSDPERKTVVLSRSDLDSVMGTARTKELEVSRAPETFPRESGMGPAHMVPATPAQPAPLAAILVSFGLGVVFGAGLVWLVLQR